MKKYFLLILSVCATIAFGQSTDTTITKSKINKVTVFFSGAQISRQVDFKAVNGQQLLLIDDLPLEVNKESLKVGDIKNSKTISVKLERGSSKNPKYKKEKEKLRQQKNEIERKIKYNRTEKGVYDSEETFIIQNRELAGNNGVTIAQIREGADYYRAKLKEIRTKKLELEFELNKFKDELLELDKQMQKITKNQRKESTQLYVLIDSELVNPNVKFEISYYLQTAAWEPVYDFRVKDVGEPLLIDYKAIVYQSTGEDWKKVDLTLSTGDPSLSSDKPELDKWFIDKRKREITKFKESADKNASLKGKLFDSETQEPIPFANIVLEIDGTQIGGTSSDFDGNYTIKPIPPGAFDLKVTSIGYEPSFISRVHIKEGKITFLDVEMKASDIVLDEFVVVDYKVPLIDKDKTATSITIQADEMRGMSDGYSNKMSARSGAVRVMGVGSSDYENPGIINSNYMIDETEKNMSDIEYKIKKAFTVLSDGKDYALKIKESKVPVEYVYFAIPKLDQDAFLTARIANWNELDLLSGKSSIYYQGIFTGESYIDDNLTNDTIDLSLGRDRDIVVTRKGNKERIERKVLGKNIKETLSWDIEIKNNKKEKVQMILEDQFPLAVNKSIEIELIEVSEAKANDKTGKLSWELELEPNSKKTIQLTYSVKYPNHIKLYLD